MTEPQNKAPHTVFPPLAALAAALLVAGGVALAGWFVGDALVTSRAPLHSVTVKGLAERPAKADLGFWPIRFVATGASLADARATLSQSEAATRDFLTAQGFEDGEIQVQNILAEDRMAGYNAGNTPDAARFVLTEDMLVTTAKVDQLSAAARKVADLLKSGVVFSSDSYSAGPSFVFTGLNSVKAEMLTEATKNAREAAQTFADESGARVGDILNATQGYFEINPAVQIPNDRPEKQIDKTIRVVTTVTYQLLK